MYMICNCFTAQLRCEFFCSFLGRFPLDVKVLKLGFQSLLGLLARPSNQSTDFQLPALTTTFNSKHPANLPQRGLAAGLINVVHPKTRAGIAILPLDSNGDGLPAGRDGLGCGLVRDAGDAPVGPVVAAHGRQARGSIEELYTCLDPLAR